MSKRNLPPPEAIGFLLPNFLGLLCFVLFPVLLSLWMAFTNWSLKPTMAIEFVGLRNFQDLLGVQAKDVGDPWAVNVYVCGAMALVAGIIASLWANFANWRGLKLTGLALLIAGLAIVTVSTMSLAQAFSQTGNSEQLEVGAIVAGVITAICGLAVLLRDNATWRPGWGALPGALVLLGLYAMSFSWQPMWSAYELRDPRFWQYLYNTAFLMSGLPLGIAGSLGLAMMLNNPLPLGSLRWRLVVAGLMLLAGLIGLGGAIVGVGFWGVSKDLVLLLAVFWLIAALAMVFNMVTFRTLFYLPTFTAGVALMILWKSLYNTKTGPINVILTALFDWLNWDAAPPDWLGSLNWAKPALMIMGLWIGVGGMNMLLYLAALSNVPRDLLDAAEVDGAGRWAKFRHVTWPQLAPTTFFISIMSIIGGLQGGFEQARVMTQGDPAGSTITLSYYIYNKIYMDMDLGYAAAISWVLFAVIFIATAMNWKFGKAAEVDV